MIDIDDYYFWCIFDIVPILIEIVFLGEKSPLERTYWCCLHYMKKNTENPSQSLKHYSIVNTELSV